VSPLTLEQALDRARHGQHTNRADTEVLKALSR
jgi:hypothetical protein